MATTPYRAISFTDNEALTDDKLGQLVSNIQWIFDHTPRVLYTAHGLSRAEGVRICGGKVPVSKQKSDTATVTVNFNGFFSVNSNPIVTTSILSSDKTNLFHSHSGIDTLHPDHRGFRVRVEVDEAGKKDKIAKQFWITWQALGY